ncbi:hypothetical protein ACFX1S_013617 [Malus domestica]
MLQHINFSWNTDSLIAFEKLKQALISVPALALSNFTKQFVVETDASNLGIGLVLCQERHPIAYLSKPLSGRNLHLSIYDKEMLAVVFVVQNWRHYLLGQQFRIVTDRKPLKHFLEQCITTLQQHKWFLKLLGYNYSVDYRPSSQNSGLDALSLKRELLLLMDLSSPIFDCIPDLQQSYTTDPRAQGVWSSLNQTPHAAIRGFSLVNGVLYYK